MSAEPFADTFDFLLRSDRFVSRQPEIGPGFAELYFRSSHLVVRLAEQREIVEPGHTLLCFLIDPHNSHRWCMFQAAVERLFAVAIAFTTRAELATLLDSYIDRILNAARSGSIPFDDFSHLYPSKHEA
jgi:hypothetical protein